MAVQVAIKAGIRIAPMVGVLATHLIEVVIPTNLLAADIARQSRTVCACHLIAPIFLQMRS
jgi:hypothetical protein